MDRAAGGLRRARDRAATDGGQAGRQEREGTAMARIVVIDDHAVVREGLRALLAGAGHQVVGAAGAPPAAHAEIVRADPELVLLDLSLEGRSGLEVLSELQRRRHPARVVVLSMSSQPRHVAEAVSLGAWGYVLKGSPNETLLKAIDAVSQGRRYLGEEEARLALQAMSAPQPAGYDSLSPRERQILVMVARGQSSATIGAELHLSPKSVDTYRSRLMAKLGLADVAAVVRWAIRHGLVPLDDD